MIWRWMFWRIRNCWEVSHNHNNRKLWISHRKIIHNNLRVTTIPTPNDFKKEINPQVHKTGFNNFMPTPTIYHLFNPTNKTIIFQIFQRIIKKINFTMNLMISWKPSNQKLNRSNRKILLSKSQEFKKLDNLVIRGELRKTIRRKNCRIIIILWSICMLNYVKLTITKNRILKTNVQFRKKSILKLRK
jgi:hypothetical protein